MSPGERQRLCLFMSPGERQRAYIRKNLKSFKHGQCEAYLEEFKPQLVLRRRG